MQQKVVGITAFLLHSDPSICLRLILLALVLL
jgi:hypothetical protein